jgi:hypothetical protein
MSLNSFNVGRDVTLTIVTDAGPLRAGGLTEFRSKQDTSEKKVKLIDGRNVPLIFPEGHSGSFMYERRDSIIDDYIAQLEADYYQGINHRGATITETITEVSGQITQYRYINAVFKLTDGGAWMGDSTVKIGLDFMAEKKLKIQ